MRPPPPIEILKLIGGRSRTKLIMPGRVEVLSFFFLGCPPCQNELPDLNELQKRYGKKSLLVADITSYKANAYLGTSSTVPASHSAIEAAIEKTRNERAPNIAMAIATDESIARYGIHAFPVSVLIDKEGRIRSVDQDFNFDDDDPLGHLIKQLVEN